MHRKEKYSADVTENTAVLSTVLAVSAYDRDTGANAIIEYAFTPRTAEKNGEIFGINSKSGDIFLNGELDYEIKNVYQLIVTASDKGLNRWNSLPMTIHTPF